MKKTRLLAKSPLPGCTPVTVKDHTESVMGMCSRVLDLTCRRQLEAVRLGPKWEEPFRRLLLVAAFIHDWGKISSHFQRSVISSGFIPQGMRHEALSFRIARIRPNGKQSLREWLTAGGCIRDDGFEWNAVMHAVLAHHRKFPPGREPQTNEPLTLHLSHPDFRELLEFGRGYLNDMPSSGISLSEPPKWNKDRTIPGKDFHVNPVMRGADDGTLRKVTNPREFQCIVNPNDRTIAQHNLLAVLKLSLIISDVLGSIADGNPGSHDIIHKMLENMDRRIFTPEIAGRIIEENLDGNSMSPRQQEAGSNPDRVSLVTMGCAAGKTVYAFRWAAIKAAGRKLFMCSPTTGTASQTYTDYVSEMKGEIASELVHSRANIDLDKIRMMQNGPAEEIDGVVEEKDILNSLSLWGKQYVGCTADAVLGMLEHHHLGMLSWTAISNGAFVFDEIHAYPESLFRTMLRFISEFKVPCLLMTATLQRHRRRQIEQCLAKFGEGLGTPPGFGESESLPRYRIHRKLSDPGYALDLANAEVAGGGKVLWISNRVSRAVDRYREVQCESSICYHSRFKYRDRVDKHARVVEMFRRGNSSPAFATTTQVAELSLNLSSSLIIMDIAPVEAMIQRLGRLNRHGELVFGKCLVIDVGNDLLPYAGSEIAVARDWLDRLPDRDVSQIDLIEAWDSLELPEFKDPRLPGTVLLRGGHESKSAPIRDHQGHMIDIILPEDIIAVKSGIMKPGEVSLSIPLPAGDRDFLNRVMREVETSSKNDRNGGSWTKHKFWLVPPAGLVEYNEETGASWKN